MGYGEGGDEAQRFRAGGRARDCRDFRSLTPASGRGGAARPRLELCRPSPVPSDGLCTLWRGAFLSVDVLVMAITQRTYCRLLLAKAA